MTATHAIIEAIEAFEDALAELEATEDLDATADLQARLYDLAVDCVHEEALGRLYELAPRFDDAGLFTGSDWAQPSRLQPSLVELTLTTRAGVGIETCSQLRFVALAHGVYEHPRVAAAEARRFLERVLALNLRSLFVVRHDAEPSGADIESAVQALFSFVIDSLGADGVLASLVSEAERVLLTRPIQIARVARMIETAAEGIARWGMSEIGREAALLYDALSGPTPLSRAAANLDDYATALGALDDPALLLEADTMCTHVRRTGLVSPHHAVLVRHANHDASQGDPRLLARALGLEDLGRVTLFEHRALVSALIDEAIHPATAQSVYGLAQLLERGALFQAAVPDGLSALLRLRVHPDVAERVVAGCEWEPAPPAKSLLVAGAISVLGTPRGVDQGQNPTCQSARAISLWAQIDPGYLLRHITQAARDDGLVMYFEGHPVDSREIEREGGAELDPELDPVSLILTPHLDRVYYEMGRRALDRDEDEHRWVNPEFHGWWVHRGFAAIIHEASGRIHRARRFVRHFFAAYHPRFNGGRALMIPQPCGVASTNLAGNFLDWHAVSIQRVDEDPSGELRVYFFNPNHDKGQDWGHGVVTSTSDHGELMGESSLPFWQFASRVYVFHFDPAEVGPLDEVTDAEVSRVVDQIGDSWGKSFAWEPAA